MILDILESVIITEYNTDSEPLRKPAIEHKAGFIENYRYYRRLNRAQIATMQQPIGLADSPLMKTRTLKIKRIN